MRKRQLSLAFALALAPLVPAAAQNLAPPGAAAAQPALQSLAPAPQGPNAVPGGGTLGQAGRPGGPKHQVGLGNILVYDADAVNSFAATAAQNVSFFGTTVAGIWDFNTLLGSGTWDAVVVDCRNVYPAGGWDPLADYVNAGGRVVMSFWNWGGESSLAAAFDVVVTGSFSLSSESLVDEKTSPAFLGVTMPNSDWNDTVVDDGDYFATLGSVPMARLAGSDDAVMARGNAGRTIAAPVFDEAGGTWIVDGSGVRLWENMLRMVAAAGEGLRILAYDDSHQNLGQAAAFELSPGDTAVASRENFAAQLTGATWDVVVVDSSRFCAPLAGWGDLLQYVNDGGHAVMSYWDWDADACESAELPAAFEVGVASSFSSIENETLFDSGTTDVFSGVSMPNTDWEDIVNDDGDRFELQGIALGIAHFGNPDRPVIVQGNAGRTVAAFVLDNAGPNWGDDAVEVWKNLVLRVTEPKASATVRTGVLGLNPLGLSTTDTPVLGEVWTANVNLAPSVGTATLSSYVTFGMGGPIQGFPFLGYELLILAPYIETQAFGVHNIPLPPDSSAV
ncbi:MAG: hypothetical protein AAF682_32855, partial [Planctomycetota bacterium]